MCYTYTYELYRYIDLLSELWCRQVVEKDIPDLITRTENILADMEALWPGYDLDINRHMILHIARHIQLSGPTWALTMFPFERKWKSLGNMMHQTAHPESNMMREFRAFKLALDFLALLADQQGCDPAPAGKLIMMCNAWCFFILTYMNNI